MPSREEHCRQTRNAFGANYEHVHRWLNDPGQGKPHHLRRRGERHHKEGVEQVLKKWGRTAAQVARVHIEMDLLEEGWTYDDPFPQNESQFAAMRLM